MKQFSNSALSFAFILLVIAFFALLILRLILVFSYIPETGGVSVNVLFSIARIINGYDLYTNTELPPYPIAQYMPLHYYVVSFFGKLFSLQNNIHAISVLHRFLCLSFDLLVIIPVYKILHTIFYVKNKKLIATVYMCIFLVLPNPNYARVDNLYFLLFLFSVYFFLKFLSNSISRNLILAAIFISLALFTKQSGLYLLAGIGLYLLIVNRDWLVTLKFSFTIIICCILLFVLLVQNHFAEFYQNAVLGLSNGISLSWFSEVIIKTFFYKMYFFVACGLAFAALTLIDFKDNRLRFIGFITIIVFGCSLIASLKWGSSTNYFTEFLTLTFLMGAIYFINTLPQPSSFVKVFFLILTPLFIITVYNDKGWGHLFALKKSKRVYHESITVTEYLKPQLKKEDLIFTSFHKENLLNILLNQHSLFPQREIVKHCTYPLKVFSYLDFQNRLDNGEVKFWIGKKDEQPGSFLDFRFKNFIPDTVIGSFSIYKQN